MRVCVTAGGELIADQYAKPLPWIGLYIATASLLCAAAMAFDAYCGFRRLKLWFPCRLFSLHATTLTVLAVATKMPLDLTKLSGMVLLCTAMGNLMPSLGAMNESEILPNVVALTIMVVTALANIWIQIGTGVIYAFLPEHAVVMVLMMVLLLIFVSTALPVPINKDLQEKLYDCKYWPISFDPAGSDALARLQMSVKKYWLITHTCRQYVPGWSATCTASGAFCLLAAAVFVEALLRGLVWESRLRLCRGTSDYGWSSSVVLSAQAAGILLGTVAPACRWFNAVRFWSTDGRGWSWKAEFRVEDYWVQRLKDWKAAPLQFQTGGGRGRRRWRRIAHRLKDAVMSSLIWVQKGVVTGSKLLRLVSVLPLSLQENVELKEYVLYFEGEEDLVRLITRSARKDAENWIEKGRRRAPATMLELIKKHSSFKDGFKEVGRIDNKRIRSQVPVEPPSCWALPLVTLAGVAVALPGIDQESVESLLCGVGEGLRYVRLIEKNLDQMGLVNMRKAADLIWHDVEFYDRWLGQDLHSVVPGEERNGRKVIEKLQEIAEERLQDFLAENHHDPETNDKGDPLEWPEKVLAAHCMDRVCRTILLDYDCKHQADDQRLFSRLQRVIADILGACLTNLSVAVFMECFCNKGEVREKSVKEAAHILGEAEEVLTLLGRPEVARLFPEERRYIHDWRKEGESGCSNLPSTLNMAYFTSP
ncbi:unnamed protein product [Spirodela intermedia]|uniref:Uncharacterized protein n=1 Tax=Spirodela intermedia TaxID=51605 RepID=A0A7I8J975_SPIIN|nr:unnamed protein product [Spirodela intermedia]CAA6666776.1 unnamed protein product [Spirodela intermedia]